MPMNVQFLTFVGPESVKIFLVHTNASVTKDSEEIPLANVTVCNST